jgi:hypothetical protein
MVAEFDTGWDEPTEVPLPDMPEPPAGEDTPWGINPKTGKPYTMSPEEREERGRILAAGRAAARSRGGKPPSKGARKGPTSVPGKPKGPDYAEAVMVTAQLPILGLSLAAKVFEGRPLGRALALDALAVKVHLPPIADAAAGLAREYPAVGAILERAMTTSPFLAMFAAVVPLCMQFAGNHGMVPENEDFGVLGPEALMGAALDAAG